MAKTIKEFKEFLAKTGYKCAKKGDEYILTRDTTDPGVVFVSAEEYFSKGKEVAPAKKKNAEVVNVEEMSFQELKAFAKENGIAFAKNITKAGLLKKIQKL